MTRDEAILLLIVAEENSLDAFYEGKFYSAEGTGEAFEMAIEALRGPQIGPETSDGYHTFNELYHHRAVLFSVIVRLFHARAWKAKKHHDGTMYGGMFIVGIDTPNGQATYHYDIEPYWTMFECKELDKAPEWDGHTPQAIERISALGDMLKRSEGCDFCNESERIQNQYGDIMEMDEGVLILDTEGYPRVTFRIKYCPDCGRELSGNAEQVKDGGK